MRYYILIVSCRLDRETSPPSYIRKIRSTQISEG